MPEMENVFIYRPGGKLTAADIKMETLTMDETPTQSSPDVKNVENDVKPEAKSVEDDAADSDDEKQAILEEENIQITQVWTILS